MVFKIHVYALNALYSPAYSGVIHAHNILSVKQHPGNKWKKKQRKKKFDNGKPRVHSIVCRVHYEDRIGS